MSNQVDVLTSLLVGAITEIQAAQRLGVHLEEVERLKRVVAGEGAALVPIAVDFAARRFELLDLAGATYREPFFHETIDRARRERPGSLDIDVDFDDFMRAAEHYPCPPDALIFHVGRCGSTLLANMLSASGEHLLIKEPEVISDLVAAWLGTDDEAARREIERLLGAAVRYILGSAGVAVGERAARYRVLKLAAWNVRLAGTLLDLFPSVPAVFVYRSPFETVASLLFQPPGWFELIHRSRSIQARFFPTVREVPDGAALSPASLYAHAWRSAAEAALALPPERLLAVEYGALVDGAETTIRRVLSRAHHLVDPTRVDVMVAARATYSKDPAGRALFAPKQEHRRPSLSPEQADEVRLITTDLWERLEARACLNRGAPEQGLV